MVARAGGGHVEEAQVLQGAHLFLVVFDGFEAGGVEVARGNGANPNFRRRRLSRPHCSARVRALRAVEACKHHDRELQALGGVHRHYADRVVVGLGDDGFGDARARVRLRPQPFDELAQGGPTGLAESARLFENEAQPLPRFAWPAVRKGHFEHAPFAQHAFHQFADAVPPAGLMQVAQRPQGVWDRVCGRLWERPGVVPAAVRLDVLVEVVVAAAEGGRAQSGDDRDVIGRVVDGREDVREVHHLLRGVEQRAAFQAIGDVRLLQRALKRGEGDACRQQDGDVVQLRRARAAGLGGYLPATTDRTDEPDHVGGLGITHLVDFHIERLRQRTAEKVDGSSFDRRVPAACEGHIAWLAWLRLAPNQVIEDEVHELEDLSAGTEVGGEVQ